MLADKIWQLTASSDPSDSLVASEGKSETTKEIFLRYGSKARFTSTGSVPDGLGVPRIVTNGSVAAASERTTLTKGIVDQRIQFFSVII